MIKIIFIILSILILSSCSFDTKSGIWTKEKIALNDKENNQIKELFKKDENGVLLRDELGNLEKINYDNLE